jgi:type VI secretion system lysozyme-like protein
MPPIRHDPILPSLLDRLAGGGTAAPYGGSYVTARRYLETVQRDLLWLLKTDAARPSNFFLTGLRRGAVELSDDLPPACLGDFPRASKSVLAYGVPLSRGAAFNSADESEFKRALEQAVSSFEPRLERLSVRVDADGDEEDKLGFSVFSVKISGHVRIKSERVDLLLQAYYTPAFAQWRIEGAAHGS